MPPGHFRRMDRYIAGFLTPEDVIPRLQSMLKSPARSRLDCQMKYLTHFPRSLTINNSGIMDNPMRQRNSINWPNV